MKTLLSIFISLLLASFVAAEQKVEFDGHELHYIVLNTTEIPAEIAVRYGIARSSKRAFINMSVLADNGTDYGTPISVDMIAMQRTLIGQKTPIELEEIRDGSAVYYIGTFPIINRETLWFDIEVAVPLGPVFEYTFSQQVWQE